jgi:hypothetical protein
MSAPPMPQVFLNVYHPGNGFSNGEEKDRRENTDQQLRQAPSETTKARVAERPQSRGNR